VEGYFAMVTRNGESYRLHVPELETDDEAYATVEDALHEAKRTIQSADDLPDPRPSIELIGEAAKLKAVAAVCVSA